MCIRPANAEAPDDVEELGKIMLEKAEHGDTGVKELGSSRAQGRHLMFASAIRAGRHHARHVRIFIMFGFPIASR